MSRIRGLDSIRFVCAAIVVMGHFGFPDPPSLPPSLRSLTGPITLLCHCLFNAPAAVIVFFLVSGFCIHHAYGGRQSLHVGTFYARRAVRIALPALAALPLYFALRIALNPPDYAVFWSVICELVYYAAYPALTSLFKRFSCVRVWVVSFLVAIALCFLSLPQIRHAGGSYTALGGLTFLVGLPCWIAGCWLAESHERFPNLEPRRVWLFRALIFFLALALRIAKFHGGYLGYSPISLNLFALLACIWLGCEIRHFQNVTPWPILERAGLWSYSLYIVHPLVLPAFALANLPAASHANAAKLIALAVTLAVSYGYYRLVEWPSHQWAKSIRLQSWTKLPPAPL